MKIFSLFAFITICNYCSAQIKSGIITYNTTYKTRPDNSREADNPFENYQLPEEEKYTYYTQFNDNYFRSTSKLGTDDYQVVIDRKSKQLIYSVTSETDKTIRFTDLSKSTMEFEKITEDSPYSYNKEYSDEENQEQGFGQDFYKELLKPKDTIVLRTTETKEILGYPCKKVILKIQGDIRETIWYTEELPELNNLSKIHSSINGFALSIIIESGIYTTETDVAEIKPAPEELSIERFLELPKGYALDLGSIYMTNEAIEPYSSPYSSLPDFISFEDRSKLLKLINTELEKAIERSKSKKESYQHFNFDLEIYFNENGTISIISYEKEGYNISDAKMKTLEAKLKKVVKIQPVTINGKPTPFRFFLDYSGSTYSEDIMHYYDEEE